MIRMVTAVDVAPGHEDELEEAWRQLRAALRQHPGFRGATLLRDSTQPCHYLVQSEWDGHAQLAQAVRSTGLIWLKRDLTTPWTAAPTRVYDEVVDIVEDTAGEADELSTTR